jgi:4-hydroxymandelate oxidase
VASTALDALTVEEVEVQARALLPEDVHMLIAAGAGAGRTIAANAAAWRHWAVRSRALVDVSSVSTATEVLGTPVAFPVLIAPSGLHTLADPEGEVATARAARAAGTIMVLSSGTGRTIEDVAATGADLWMQVYWGRDRGRLLDIVDQAAAAGFKAICVTVDLPVRPLLERPMKSALGTLGSVQPLYMPPRDAHLDAAVEWDHDARLTWSDLDWLRERSPLPIVLKGIMTAEDAGLAAEAGAAAIVVSNHGGRALDNGLATLDVLAEVVSAAGGRLSVLVDGGIRRGHDVVVALALGARAVLVGRPALWGLAAGGAAGVEHVLGLLRHETATILAQAGVVSAAAIPADAVRRLA